MVFIDDSTCILFLGDSTVGKTALAQSFTSDGTQFAKSYNMVNTPLVHVPILFSLTDYQCGCVCEDSHYSKHQSRSSELTLHTNNNGYQGKNAFIAVFCLPHF